MGGCSIATAIPGWNSSSDTAPRDEFYKSKILNILMPLARISP
jgi:hypothetical protein